MAQALLDSDLKNLRLLSRGKVRDIYEIDDHHLLMVTTDRISAFDVILPTAIPGKGAALTAISHFWFQCMQDIIANHLSDLPLETVLPDEAERARVADCAMVVKRLKPLPVEAIVRGYLVGSGWKDYQNSGQVCGIDLPQGLQLADQLPQAIYTPSTKAEVGEHDVNIDFDKTVELLGADLATQVRNKSLEIYSRARDYAATRGIIIADTKFEFGLDEDNNLVLIDEVLTPDSSRFWPMNEYEVGKNPPSYDKQFVRDYLETLDWDKKAPGPKLPPEVVQKTIEKYNEALQRLAK